MFNHSIAHAGSGSRQQATNVINILILTLYCIILSYNIETFDEKLDSVSDACKVLHDSPVLSFYMAESIGVWFRLVLALGLQRCTLTR